jgi:hypothetical protein
MKRIGVCLLIMAFAVGAGCNNDKTPGGPGVKPATDKPAADKPAADRPVADKPADKGKPLVGEADNTFTLSTPTLATSITQGENKNVTIGINRGTNFQEDVTLKFDGMPKGVTVDPANPKIAKSDTEAKVTLKAANDAAVGDFKVKVIGTPTKGAEGSSDMSVTVKKK